MPLDQLTWDDAQELKCRSAERYGASAQATMPTGKDDIFAMSAVIDQHQQLDNSRSKTDLEYDDDWSISSTDSGWANERAHQKATDECLTPVGRTLQTGAFPSKPFTDEESKWKRGHTSGWKSSRPRQTTPTANFTLGNAA